MSQTTLIRVEVELIQDVQNCASKGSHQDMPYGRAVAWLYGEYKRLARFEKMVKADVTTVSLTPKGEADCGE
jgi:hypothetical protein